MKTLLPVIAILASLCVVGCAKDKKTTTANSGVTDIASPSVEQAAYQPVTVTPTYTPMAAESTTVTETPVAASAAGTSYKVKKGDTLYAIAKSHYGDGKQYTKIVSANPGITPQNLKVGQTITIP